MIGALQAAKLDVSPLLVSTRDNGAPNKLAPQRTDFNYVVAAVTLGDKIITLDATDPFLPFGSLPFHCLNDQGRLLSRTNAQWLDLKPSMKSKTSISLDLLVNQENLLEGMMSIQYVGYEASRIRKRLLAEGETDFIKDLASDWNEVTVNGHTIAHAQDISQPLTIEMKIVIEGIDFSSAQTVYFHPFIVKFRKDNPFKQSSRTYPIDLGAPIEYTYHVALQLPAQFEVEEFPESVSSALPLNGGRHLMNVSVLGEKINLTSSISLAKSLYHQNEYPYLKELFSQVVQAQESAFVLKKK